MYPFLDFITQNSWGEGVSYINLVYGFVMTLKIVYYCYIYILFLLFFIIILMIKSTYPS
jgi:hypothetical protein